MRRTCFAPKPLIWGYVLLALWCLTPGGLAAENQSITSIAQLRQKLKSLVGQPRFASSQWGIEIKSLDTGSLIFEDNSQLRLKPASNAKLFTGALAFEELGPDFRIVTSIAASKKPTKSGSLNADLIIIGRGDPSFSARFHNGDYSAALTPLVDEIVKSGIRKINGDIVADESYFRGPALGKGWTWDDLQYYYGAEVSACTYQDNVVDLYISPGTTIGSLTTIKQLPFTPLLHFINRVETVNEGGQRSVDISRASGENLVVVKGQLPLHGKPWIDAVTVPRPALWFAQELKDALQKRGIRVKGDGKRITADEASAFANPQEKLVALGSVSSPPLSELVMQMMKHSQNLYAQLLLLQVGAHHPDDGSSPSLTTEEAGLRRMSSFVSRIGIQPGDVMLEEGSGLSRGGLVTPRATVQLLTYAAKQPYQTHFIASLPIAGIDGSLRYRMKDTVAAGNARAKTGSLRFVNTLSGYVTNKAGEKLVFSLMLNAHVSPEHGPSAKDDLDQIVVWLAESGFQTNSAK